MAAGADGAFHGAWRGGAVLGDFYGLCCAVLFHTGGTGVYECADGRGQGAWEVSV